MSGSVVYLFVDTNLLVQCRPLEELDWSAWNEFDEVRLIVSKPVQREIDYRKNKGNDRVGKRARRASAMFREMLNDKYKVVCDSDPCVKLSVEPQHQYSRKLEDHLNYQERDDQLIGTVYEFVERHPGADVRLLTHDTTPLYTAQGLELAVDIIPDEWLLPPENTGSEKELTALKDENARLKKAEPSFVIRCLGSADTEIERYEISVPRFKSLTAAETNALMQRLKKRFPLETDFQQRESTERNTSIAGILISNITERLFIPVTEEAIEKYREEAYPQWLADCGEALSKYHQTLQEQEPMPRFRFLAENRGTRPAINALITIEAQGGFQIQPPAQDDESESLQEKPTVLLHSPPPAPRGRWKVTNHMIANLARFSRLVTPLPPRNYLPSNYPLSRLPQPRDPNAFFFKPDRPRTPQDTFCLECDQWRHEDGEEDFEGEFHLPADLDTVKGTLICRIQAGNLSKSAFKLIPVRITTALVSTFDRASAAVEALAEHSGQSDIERTAGEG